MTTQDRKSKTSHNIVCYLICDKSERVALLGYAKVLAVSTHNSVVLLRCKGLVYTSIIAMPVVNVLYCMIHQTIMTRGAACYLWINAWDFR